VLIVQNRIDADGAKKIIEAFQGIDSVLQIFDFKTDSADPEIEELLRQREHARKEKNWVLSDELRKQLQAKGVTVQDHKI